MPGFYVHGYDAKVADGGCCDRCEVPLGSAYHVSHQGERATHRLCPRCFSFLRASYGCRSVAAQDLPGDPPVA